MKLAMLRTIEFDGALLTSISTVSVFAYFEFIFTFYCRKNHYLCVYSKFRTEMSEDLNRIKVVLVEKKRTSKWLAEKMGKDPATVSKWCTNKAQPNVATLVEIARCLEVDTRDLLRPINEINEIEG